MNVGSMIAQDQRSIAAGEAPEEAPPVDAPGAESAADAFDPAADSGFGMRNPMMMMGMGMMGGMGGRPDVVYYIHTDSTQYTILPFKLTVLVDQNRIQDYLVALENSPMAIQVKDFEMQKPTQPVKKPEKGTNFGAMGFGYGDSMMGMMGMGRMGGGRYVPFGGQQRFGSMMDIEDRMGMGMMMPGGRGMMMPGGYGRGGRAGGRDVRGMNPAEKRKAEEEAMKKALENPPPLHDQYFNIVQVTVYGQARFYNAPPPDEAPAEGTTSPGQPATPPAEGAAAGTEPGAAPAKAETPETPKAETPEAPKAEAPAPDAAAPAPANPPAAPDAAGQPPAAEPTKPAEPAPASKPESRR
jgi:hypothetical protein